MQNVKALFQSIQESIKTKKSQMFGDESQMSSEQFQASQHKEIGNQCLQAGFIDEAIMHYTKSIALDPTNHIVYTNRATAFKKHKEFQLMLEDSQKAMDLDCKYFKAYLRHGEAAIELGKKPTCTSIELIDKGLKSLQQAYSLCWNMPQSDPKYKYKQTFEKEISNQILRAKKILWFKEHQLQQTEREIILEELKCSLKIDECQPGAPEVAQCEQDKREEQATPGGGDSSCNNAPSSISEEQKKININIYLKVQEQFQTEQAEKQRQQLEVPDYLVCRITDELMDEPVLLQSGFTYEKSEIMKHFEKNGNFDPMTREEVDPKVLILNKQIRQATQDFLIQNPWAFERVYGETLEQISM